MHSLKMNQFLTDDNLSWTSCAHNVPMLLWGLQQQAVNSIVLDELHSNWIDSSTATNTRLRQGLLRQERYKRQLFSLRVSPRERKGKMFEDLSRTYSHAFWRYWCRTSLERPATFYTSELCVQNFQNLRSVHIDYDSSFQLDVKWLVLVKCYESAYLNF